MTTSPSSETLLPAARARDSRAPWVMLTALLAGQFMALLDSRNPCFNAT